MVSAQFGHFGLQQFLELIAVAGWNTIPVDAKFTNISLLTLPTQLICYENPELGETLAVNGPPVSYTEHGELTSGIFEHPKPFVPYFLDT